MEEAMTEKLKTEKAYGIRHKVTKEVWKTPKGKKVWSRISYAKNAWNNGNDWMTLEAHGITLVREGPYNRVVKGYLFHEQDVFEIFEYGTDYSESLELLKRVHLSDALEDENLRDEIALFLKSQKVV